MRTLHLFGDSFTQGHLLDVTFEPYKKWREHIGRELPEPWGDILVRKLNILNTNHAIAGMSNPEIFQTICQHSHEFKCDDIVIVNWTYNHRFRWVIWDSDEMKYQWKRLSINKEENPIIPEIVRGHIAVNRSHPMQIDEIYQFEKLLKEYSNSKGFHIFFWSADIDIINDLPNNKLSDFNYILHDEIMKLPPFNLNNDKIRTMFDVIFKHGGKTIEEELGFNIFDGGHLGESGHKVQAELFYDYLVKHLGIKKII
jgi:hypothetical protein